MSLYHAGGYKYMEDLLYLDGCRPVVPRAWPASMRRVSSPLHQQEWDRGLRSHSDQRFRKYIVEGVQFGFRVGFNYNQPTRSARHNMLSAREHPEAISEHLLKECSEGRVLGPLDPAHSPPTHISRFGVIPKGSSGKWRLIVDMSAPEGASVNDGIDEARSALSYVGVGDAVRGITSFGRGTLLAKVDIKSAYRNIPVHPDDRWLMGMQWGGALYVDTALPFGLRSAPKIFTAVADAVEWMARQEGVRFIIHYLENFLVMGPPSSPECGEARRKLLEILGRLGLPVAEEKLEGPTTSLDFLGFTLDTELSEIRLPRAKLEELRVLLQQWRGRKSCTRKELESLTGKLAHAAKAVKPGKTFLGRMFRLLGGVRKAHYRVRLNLSFRSDILWWDTFAASWNGVSLLKPTAEECVHVWTDASGAFGCGAFVPASQDWFQFKWPDSYLAEGVQLKEESIALKELLPIVMSCAIWGRDWASRTATMHCDNLGVVSLVNSGYSRVPQIMHLLRCLFFIRARFQLDVWAVHVPGVQNSLADAISRNNLDAFLMQVPGATHHRRAVPPKLLELLGG